MWAMITTFFGTDTMVVQWLISKHEFSALRLYHHHSFLCFFQLGTDNYDNSEKVRIPSYTDRILFKSKRKHGIVCHKYDSAAQLKSSDHKPVYGLYQVSESNKGVCYTYTVKTFLCPNQFRHFRLSLAK